MLLFFAIYFWCGAFSMHMHGRESFLLPLRLAGLEPRSLPVFRIVTAAAWPLFFLFYLPRLWSRFCGLQYRLLFRSIPLPPCSCASCTAARAGVVQGGTLDELLDQATKERVDAGDERQGGPPRSPPGVP